MRKDRSSNSAPRSIKSHQSLSGSASWLKNRKTAYRRRGTEEVSTGLDRDAKGSSTSIAGRTEETCEHAKALGDLQSSKKVLDEMRELLPLRRFVPVGAGAGANPTGSSRSLRPRLTATFRACARRAPLLTLGLMGMPYTAPRFTELEGGRGGFCLLLFRTGSNPQGRH